MSYTPIIAGAGMVGWQMLQNTLVNQQRAFENTAEILREGNYFRENIGSMETPEDLVGNRRLLRVALAAFGMESETDTRRLIQTVLEEGTEDGKALANRLNDSRYVAFADVFNFDVSVESRTREEGFAEPILASYEERVRANLQTTLAEPRYLNDPAYAALFKAEVEDNIANARAQFEAKIDTITSAEALLADSELLNVVLTAFDIEDRRGSQTLLRRVLEEGTEQPGALANVLGDNKLIKLSEAFGFDKTRTSTILQTETFASNIVDQYHRQAFEDAVAQVDPAIGNALRFQGAVPELAESDISENAKWYNVLGSTTMRTVFETALNLPDGFSQIDIDKQVDVLRDKLDRRFGIKSFAELKSPVTLNRVIHGYLLQDQIASTAGIGSSQIALTLLGSIGNSNTG